MEESEKRDIERAEEYDLMISRGSLKGENKFEISTGIIIAARFADKLRRIAIVALGKLVPRDVIIRDISELNKELYKEIVEKRKFEKLDLIKIIVDGYYDTEQNKIVWTEYKILRYVSEDKFEKLLKENEELKRTIEKLKNKLEEIKKILS